MNTIPQAIDFVFRVFVLIFAMTIGIMFIFVGAKNALAANLRTTAIIHDTVFTVGDIFSGLPEETASKVLGPAPQPGHDIVLNARTLMRVAIALELPWRPQTSTEQVVVRSAAAVIDKQDIELALSERLQSEGVDGKYGFNFLNIANPQIVLPAAENETVEVVELSFNPQTDVFKAKLAAPSKARALSEIEISGKLERMISVPIVTKTVSKGSIINATDIDWIDIKSNELQNDTIIDERKLVGMTPRRMISGGKPVRNSELERPQLISRGDTITITYNEGFMALTAKGRAMQDGARGDVIRVVNTASNKTVDAIVEDQYLVTVTQ